MLWLMLRRDSHNRAPWSPLEIRGTQRPAGALKTPTCLRMPALNKDPYQSGVFCYFGWNLPRCEMSPGRPNERFIQVSPCVSIRRRAPQVPITASSTLFWPTRLKNINWPPPTVVWHKLSSLCNSCGNKYNWSEHLSEEEED